MCIPSDQRRNQLQLNKLLIQKQLQKLNSFESIQNTADFQNNLPVEENYGKFVYMELVKFYKDIKQLPAYRLLTTVLTQQAHLITAIAVITVAFIINPEHHNGNSSKLLNFIYLGSFATYLGTQIWMTFMSGLSLYFSLPRHHFGEIQKVLFPKYFTFNSILCFIMLTIFAKNHNCEIGNDQTSIQVYTLVVSFLINLLIRLYLAPPLLHLIEMKNRLEQEAGFGMEIGHHDLGQLKECPIYIPIQKSFRKVHATIAVGNIATMACSIFHLYYLSSKLCLL